MSDHFTLRFQPATTKRLQRRARSTGTPPRSLAQRYVEEGLRGDDHPRIGFVNGASGRRASLTGTGLDVWEVIATVRDNDNERTAAAIYLDVDVGLIDAAIAYYGEFRDEIDSEIGLNEDEFARGRALWQAGQQALNG